MKKVRRCCICNTKLPIGDYGNNPEPIKPFSEGICCDNCNRTKVIPARLKARAESGAKESSK